MEYALGHRYRYGRAEFGRRANGERGMERNCLYKGRARTTHGHVMRNYLYFILFIPDERERGKGEKGIVLFF